MEDRETARMRKYGESKTTRIMMATVPHVTSGLGLRKFQTDGFLLTRVYYPDHGAHYEGPHYAVFTTFLLLPASWIHHHPILPTSAAYDFPLI